MLFAVWPLVEEMGVAVAMRQVLKVDALAVVQQDRKCRLLVGGACVGQTARIGNRVALFVSFC